MAILRPRDNSLVSAFPCCTQNIILNAIASAIEANDFIVICYDDWDDELVLESISTSKTECVRYFPASAYASWLQAPIGFAEDDKDLASSTQEVPIKKTTTSKSLSSQALSLAHKISPAYSSFRRALLAAYAILRSKDEARKIVDAMLSAYTCLCKLGQLDKSKGIRKASLAVFDILLA